MEPITLCGAVILAVGLWVEFESIIMKVARAISVVSDQTFHLVPTKNSEIQ